MRKKGEGERRRSDLSTLLEQLVIEVPESVRPVVLRVLHSVRADSALPSREDLATLMIFLLSRERDRRVEAQGRPRKVVRTQDPPPPKEPQRTQVRSAFHDRILEGEAAVEGPVSQVLRRRLGVGSDTRGRRRRPDDE